MSDSPRPRTLSVAIRRLEAAERVVSKLMGELAEARDENAAAQKRIAELEAALRPFADAAASVNLPDSIRSTARVWARTSNMGPDAEITVAHLDAAAAALRREENA